MAGLTALSNNPANDAALRRAVLCLAPACMFHHALFEESRLWQSFNPSFEGCQHRLCPYSAFGLVALPRVLRCLFIPLGNSLVIPLRMRCGRPKSCEGSTCSIRVPRNSIGHRTFSQNSTGDSGHDGRLHDIGPVRFIRSCGILRELPARTWKAISRRDCRGNQYGCQCPLSVARTQRRISACELPGVSLLYCLRDPGGIRGGRGCGPWQPGARILA